MRTDDDQWAITESVGVTALGVASGRAMETQRADGLVHDPYAASFVRAVAHEVDMPTHDDGTAEAAEWANQSTYVGVRSRFFDRFLTEVTAAGVRQVVLLAAGLDTRAQRLDWPAGTTVYEIDQAGVLDFKEQVLTAQDATHAGGGGQRVAVRVDLRHDWPGALRAAGFDPARPTAWLAEGLLPYLPAQAESDLFDRVQELSAPGSRMAVEHFADAVSQVGHQSSVASLSRRMGVDVRELIFDDARPDAGRRLTELGWAIGRSTAEELARAYGRPLDAAMAEGYGAVQLLAATKEG